eukprot:5135400-Prymnesium_polylepis.1
MNYQEGDVLGTDLVRRLRDELSWTGALFIQSANDTKADERIACWERAPPPARWATRPPCSLKRITITVPHEAAGAASPRVQARAGASSRMIATEPEGALR